MPSFNKVILIGNLTRDPDIRQTQNGTAVCSLDLAVNRRWRDATGNDQDEVCFVPVTAWSKTAENCAQYLTKGSPVMVEGRLKLDQWEDRQTGEKRSRLSVVAENVQFLSSRADSDAGDNSGSRQDSGSRYHGNGGSRRQGNPPPQQQPQDPPYQPEDDPDDIPF